MTSSILERVRAAAKEVKPEHQQRVLDKADRIDQTYAPDAKKARQIVTTLRTQSLPLLCTQIAKVTGEQAAKHALQNAFENFAVCNSVYMKEELRANNQLIEWMGGPNGFMAALPDNAPEHKRNLVKAWNEMLTQVNNATKVGVQKRHRELPISLIADLETDKLILPSDDGWN